MTDSIRAALERLIARLDETTDPNGPVPAWSDSFLAARTLLAQPEPAGEVSDEELHDTFYRHSFDDFRQRLMTWQEFHAGARAAIALALSRHASQVADGDRQPSGYAYRYQQFGDSVIRFNGGGEVNGSRPTEAIPYWLGRPSDALAARPLLEQVARMGDCIGANTVGQIMAISDRAASWLRENPPGQPVAIEPRGCPIPGACSCVEPAPPTEGEVAELVAELREIVEAYQSLHASSHIWKVSPGPKLTTDTLTRAADLLEHYQPPQPVAEALAARPLLEMVLGIKVCTTLCQIHNIQDRIRAWLEANPPGQPVAIEPRGCPTPGACSCVEPQPVAVGERLPELRQRFETTLNGARCLSDRPVGNVELADRLLDDVLAWHTPTTPPEAA